MNICSFARQSLSLSSTQLLSTKFQHSFLSQTRNHIWAIYQVYPTNLTDILTSLVRSEDLVTWCHFHKKNNHQSGGPTAYKHRLSRWAVASKHKRVLRSNMEWGVEGKILYHHALIHSHYAYCLQMICPAKRGLCRFSPSNLGNDSLRFWPLQNSPQTHPWFFTRCNTKSGTTGAMLHNMCTDFSRWLVVGLTLVFYGIQTIPGTSPRNSPSFKSLSQDSKPPT